MFIGRRIDGTIYGCWTTRQQDDEHHPRQEEVADDLPELLAFLVPKVPTAAKLIDAAFPQTGTARVLFEALYELANDVRVLKGQATITRAQLKSWLESKLP